MARDGPYFDPFCRSRPERTGADIGSDVERKLNNRESNGIIEFSLSQGTMITPDNRFYLNNDRGEWLEVITYLGSLEFAIFQGY